MMSAKASRVEGSSLQQWLTTNEPESRYQARMASLYQGWLAFKANRLALFGLFILAILLLTAAFAPVISPHGPFTQDLGNRLQPIGSEGHLLGTIFSAV